MSLADANVSSTLLSQVFTDVLIKALLTYLHNYW